MLDTNILIDFFLIDLKEEGITTERLKKSAQIREKHLKGKFINVYSIYNIWEFKNQLTKLFLQRKFIKQGYSLDEFSEAKKEIFLSKEELLEIDKITTEMFEGSLFIELEIRLETVDDMINEGVSFFDTILLYHVNFFEQCKYFVTRDNILINKIKNLPFKVTKSKLIKRKEFLSLLNKTPRQKPLINPT